MSKQELLSTQMNQLGLGWNFNRWFFDNRYGNQMTQEDVITLAEFFSKNDELLTNKDSYFCMRRKDGSWHNGFIKDSVSFRTIKKFLLENGFTHLDWLSLLQDLETSRGKRPNYALLEKEVLRNMSFFKVGGVKQVSESAVEIENYFIHEESHNRTEYILIKDILGLTQEKIESEMVIRLVENTLKVVQRKLKEYGFTSADGPFMKIKFSNDKSRASYIEDLVKYYGFTRRDAKMAVEYGIRAEWIKVSEEVEV